MSVNTRIRVLLLGLLLVAFGRVTWQLGDKGLWWDESLSLQRAEQPLIPLLAGHLVMFDGVDAQLTIDQHPFFFFLLQGILIRVAGDSEYALRFVSVMAATLLVAAVYALSRGLARRASVPATTPIFAALMASVNPFFLWYGQEARPYALWALLAVLSSYCLLKVTLASPGTRPPLAKAPWARLAYGGTLLALLATHYYSVFLLPLHALAWFVRLYRSHKRAAIVTAIGLLSGGALLAGAAYYRIIVMQGGGGNFPTINLRILVPDLLNAFSMGLSVNINEVWWLDLVYAAVALLGVGWMVWRPQRLLGGGWLPVLMVLTPVIMVLIVNRFTPAYMNARHLSLIGGGYLIVLGAGLAVLWQARSRLLALLALTPVTALLIAGAGYSTLNYYTQEEFTHDDLAGVGRHLAGRVAEGDLLLLKPPFSWRIFDYYLPTARVDAAIGQGAQLGRLGVPRLVYDWDFREAELAAVTPDYRRIWLVTLGTHPYLDLEDRVEAWLDDHLFQVQSLTYFSHSRLRVTLYLPEVPVTWESPNMQYAHSATFGAADGEQIRLAGYDVGSSARDGLQPELYEGIALPVTLYWQTLQETDRRYKYILRLVQVTDGDTAQIAEVMSLTEREPYDGAIPTIFWAPGQTIAEMTELPPSGWDAAWNAVRENPAHFRLALEVYDGETLEKLPITATEGAAQAAGEVVLLPLFPRE